MIQTLCWDPSAGSCSHFRWISTIPSSCPFWLHFLPSPPRQSSSGRTACRLLLTSRCASASSSLLPAPSPPRPPPRPPPPPAAGRPTPDFSPAAAAPLLSRLHNVPIFTHEDLEAEAPRSKLGTEGRLAAPAPPAAPPPLPLRYTGGAPWGPSPLLIPAPCPAPTASPAPAAAAVAEAPDAPLDGDWARLPLRLPAPPPVSEPPPPPPPAAPPPPLRRPSPECILDGPPPACEELRGGSSGSQA